MFLSLQFYALSGLVNCLTSTALGILLLAKSPKEIRNRIFAYFCFAVGFWSWFYFVWLSTPQKSLAEFYLRTCMIGVIFMPTLFMHFIFHFLKLKKSFSFNRLNYILSIIFMLSVYTPLYGKDIGNFLVFPYWLKAGVVFHLAISHFIIIVCYAFYLIWKKLRGSEGVFRNQLLYVFIGTGIGYFCGSTNYFAWYRIPIPPFLNIFISVYVVMVTYAILRYHLMDIKVAIVRVGILVLVYLVVLGLPLFLGYKYQLWKISTFLAIILASFGSFIYGRLRQGAESIILANQLRYQKALKEFAPTLIFIKDLDKLTQAVDDKIMDSINLQFAAFYLREDSSFYLSNSKTTDSFKFPSKIGFNSKFTEQLKKSTTPLLGEHLPKLAGLNLGAALPLYLNQELYGFILLGQKQEDFFTDTDLDMFSILAGQVSLALSEIYYFKEYQKATDAKHKLELEKARLESAFQISQSYRHELGNILNIISTSLGNLMFTGNYVPTKEDIDQTRNAISNNVKKAQRIFKAIKDYIENAKVDFKPTELSKVLKSKIEEKKPEISQSKIKLETYIANNILVLANGNLAYSLGHLIDGAIRAIAYYKPAERLISIELDKNDTHAILKISDTGNDVTKDTLYEGVGIERGKEGGILYFIARRIIFDHQGTFQITSFNQYKGTSFVIELPLMKEGG